MRSIFILLLVLCLAALPVLSGCSSEVESYKDREPASGDDDPSAVGSEFQTTGTDSAEEGASEAPEEEGEDSGQ